MAYILSSFYMQAKHCLEFVTSLQSSFIIWFNVGYELLLRSIH